MSILSEIMDSKVIQKYQNKGVASLINIAVRHFHKFIRERDEGLPCISCGNYRTLQAGHFQSAGKFARLRFNEYNVNGQCKQCNFYGGMEIGASYERNLRKKIGNEEVDEILLIASDRTPFKWDRFTLIETIEKYKSK